jgi:DNA polymerase III subunit gamma/tau
MSWYRQYRPTSVRQLHLTTVRKTLQEMMASGNFPHAFLFAGPKGTGKTSSARIVAAILNDPANSAAVDALFFAGAKGKAFQEPNAKDDVVQRIQRGSSYVVSELDAASNRGIDDIRQLKERIFLPPQEGKVSVYILDEAHMLTTEAFNALLKILEEPPAHVVFILATTELHKIPETIVSRCAVVRFHKASEEELISAMEQILAAEDIRFEQGALQQLAQLADGSFRDAVKLLEMVAAGKQSLTNQDVEQVVQGAQQSQIQKLIQAILDKQEQSVVQFFNELRQSGTDQKFFFTQLMNYLHNQLLLAITEGEGAAAFSAKVSHYLLTQFATASTEVSGSIPFLNLELKSLEMIFKSKDKNGSSSGSGGATVVSSSVPEKRSAISSAKQGASVQEKVYEVTAPVLVQFSSAGKEETIGNTIGAQQVMEKWDDFLAMVRQKNSSIEALLRSSKPIGSNGDKTKVEVYYQFHREQLQTPKFRSLLDECSQALFGGRIAFEFLLAEASQPGASLSTVSGKVDDNELIQLAKEILV